MMIPSGSLLPEDVMLLWELFSFVPIDDDDRIEEPFMGFPVGTDKLEIWHWFDERWPGGVVDLLTVYTISG